MHLIERRLGKDRVAECIEGVSKSEHYIRAAQRPQPLAKNASELLLEYQFTKLYKALEGTRHEDAPVTCQFRQFDKDLPPEWRVRCHHKQRGGCCIVQEAHQEAGRKNR